ncbi:response regulator [Rubripirellula obstinata]|uniref:response regulator n=1 Tax=Rubripirellula obstinata TaxID=406547 RepID=UPI0008334311|nr:response regulator [Rubripirellula obstinata]
MATIEAKPIDILLVEDSDADAHLTERALLKGKIDNKLHRATDGVEAMAFLRGEAPFADAPRPDLILLDLNMPRMDGKAVLREIGADPSLRLIPVVVLTTSNHDNDILETYGLNSNAYIVKPVDVSQFFEVIQKTHDFWLRVVKLPPA